MRKTVMYMLLAAAVLGMGGCGKANQPASADNGGTEAKKAEAAIELSVFAGWFDSGEHAHRHRVKGYGRLY